MGKNKAHEYAKKVASGSLTDCYGKKTKAPAYVVRQCENFLEISEGKSDKYMIDERKVTIVENLLKMLNMPLGINAGQSLYDCTTGYQWLFYIAVLCTVFREDPEHRRYETAILEICRKNYKTYTIGTLFIILMLTEPRFSKLYSVAPDGALSREVKEAIGNTLKCSPVVFKDSEGRERWKVLRDYIKCDVTDVKYTPLNYTNSRFDGKLPAAFLADEVGALPNNYAIEAMRSGQLNVKNKLGCIISTKYPTVVNPFEDEVDYAKKVLDGIVDDDTVFALLYEPDETKAWATDDLILQQGNPAALEREEIWLDLVKKRRQAIEKERARENFLTKHCNISYQGAASESFISIDLVKACESEKLDFTGKNLYIGVDLSQTNDNCAVAIAALDEDENIISDVIAFVPEGRIDEKEKFEKVDYRLFIQQMKCIACGDMVVDYSVIEDFVNEIETRYGGRIVSIGYDRYNAISSAQKWAQNYTTVEIRQHSDTLHPATKCLSEHIESGKFRYEKNDLLVINFQNARCTYDTNLNRYVNKKKSNGKVDMVVALINAVYLLNQDVIFGDQFFVQVI
jgi:phage terminase large subunit-like protein